MKCKICETSTVLFFTGDILQKYKISYYRCPCCEFIQTESPYWLKEAYADVIVDSDIGVVDRTIELSAIAEKVLINFYPTSSYYLDYGGGYGLFVRRMRDKGFNFYWNDPYCKNIFAKHFSLAEAPVTKFDIVTSFEVFEHLEEPLVEINKMLKKGDSLIFSTVLAPKTKEEFANWWYRCELTGQHIAFYSKKTLEYIAALFNKKLYSNNQNFHVFSAPEVSQDLVREVFFNKKKKETLLQKLKRKIFKKDKKASVRVPRQSLLPEDYQFILTQARSKKEI